MATWKEDLVLTQDPGDYLDWKYDWISWLGSGDDIAAYVFTIPAGLTIDNDTNDLTSVTFWVGGGTAGQTYDVTLRITTTMGRATERSITFRILDL